MQSRQGHEKQGNGRRSQSLRQVGIKHWLSIAFLSATVLATFIAGYFYYIQSREKQILVVAAGPYQSDSYTLLEEIAEVVTRHSSTLELKVVATGSPSESISALNRREFDLASIRSSTPVIKSTRMIANLYPDYFQLIINQNSQIDSFQSLAGKRIAIPPYGTEANRFFFIMMDHFDVPLSETTWEAVGFAEATQMMFSREVEAFFTVRSLRDRRLLRFFEEALASNMEIDYIPVDQAAAIALKRPFLKPITIPKGAFVGANPTPVESVETASVMRVLVARSDVDPEAIRELTRILFENRLDLTIRFALATAISQPDTAEGLTIPLHEGAAAYYDRNEPSFLHENAEPIALLITIFAMIGSALLALRGRLNASQKNRLDSFNYRLLDIASLAREADSLSQLKILKADLFGVLETVVNALDTDAVTEEGFQSFSLLWETVREIINDREKELS